MRVVSRDRMPLVCRHPTDVCSQPQYPSPASHDQLSLLLGADTTSNDWYLTAFQACWELAVA